MPSLGDPRDHLGQGLFLDDRLGREGCVCGPACRYLVSQFRFGVGHYRRMGRVFVASTPSEFMTFSSDAVEIGRLALATFDLDAYPNFDSVMEAAKDTSEKRGRANREYARAQRLGYFVKPFAYRQFIPDIFAIHQSKQVRQGRELRGPLYAKTVEQMGGAPSAPVAIEAPDCPQHHWQYWGVFLRVEGYRQGDVQTDEQLVAYIRLRRQGISAAYTLIMGHGDHLRHGVMYLLHYGIVACLLQQQQPERPRYIVYLHYTTGKGEGIDVWKQRALFKPRYLHYVEDRPVCLPCDPPMPGFGEALLALKATVFEPWPRAVQIARSQGLREDWLRRLHHMWVVEQTHAPRLTTRLLRESPNPTLEPLRSLAAGLFPIEHLDSGSKVAVVLHGDERGLDSLLQIHDAGFRDVTVYHPGQAQLEVLEGLYDGWSFQPLTETISTENCGALIIECPSADGIAFARHRLKKLIGQFTGLLIVSFGERVLGFFGYDAARINAIYGLYGDDPDAATLFCDQFSQLSGRRTTFRGAHYRDGDPEDRFWIAVMLHP
ncbi:MAG: hypothetical protein K1X51_17425 [Rhodospirillaceae bacterium]|nr:hypothetical protein [Rhodospirillaceae bacterium]